MSNARDSLVLLSNVNLGPLASKMSKLLSDKHTEVQFDGFNTLELRLHDENYLASQPKGTKIWIHPDFNYPGICDIDHHRFSHEDFLNEFKSIVSNWTCRVSQYPHLQFVISTPHFHSKWNRGKSNALVSELLQFKCLEILQEKGRQLSNLDIFPFHRAITNEGENESYDPRLWTLGRIPYTYPFIQKLAQSFVDQQRPRVEKKVLVLDLDNTLWGGLLDEHESSPIQLSTEGLGLAYYNFQKALKTLKESGVLLAIVSKNELKHVQEMLGNHPFMVLHNEDFVEIIANWECKSDNILQLSKSLSLSIDSFVFIDDNPREREEVASILSDVAIPQFPDDPAMLENWVYEEIVPKYFDNNEVTETDQHRTKQYQARKKRKSEEADSSSFESYLKGLQIKLEIRRAEESEIPRVQQLLERSNQFNLNKSNPLVPTEDNETWVLYYEDKFGKEGLVGVAVIEHTATVIVRKMAISCRVLEKRVEYAFLKKLLTEKSLTKIGFQFEKSDKNSSIEKFLEQLCAQRDQETAVYYYSTSNNDVLDLLCSCIEDAT